MSSRVETRIERTPTMHYKNYDIFVIASPRKDGHWFASGEVQKFGAQGLEIAQQFSGPFKAKSETDAKLAVIRDAKMKIDAILASLE
ncbi:hypothetical protein UNDYM_3669 [Undibacterium sp. YM2]|uniref:hypothetical protein n=1 Tax=Undibacterium sp. YM2 TaxID=2058625 RepID=UPI001331D386|nr:hypothetical protein [Undibacterium sp. YM2]BBB67922.1 hypothetical protein UNDYM_3669 [Undibacterium sp. YM2]